MHLDPKSRERARIVVGERFGEEPGDKALVVPDLEKILLAKHVHVARHQGALSQARLNQHAPLRIQFGHLSVEIHAIQEPPPRRVRGGHLRESTLDVEPDRHRINLYRMARQARHEEFRAVILLDGSTKPIRNL